VRLWDRFYDLDVNVPMQAIVADRLRPDDRKDAFGVEQAKARLQTAYAVLEREMGTKPWAAGDTFSMADCAAAPALFYADKVMPFGKAHANVARYFARLKQRPSYARALQEAEPYFHFFPSED
jgi:glutathione S-transferase